MNKEFDCLVIGAGPCGITAAIEIKKAGFSVAILDEGMPGGKVNIAPRVDNYPGYKEISGPDLAMEFFSRLMAADISIIPENVISLTLDNELPVLVTESETYMPKTVFIASGTKEKKLGLPKEDELFGHGVSYCAVCDGHFYKGREAVVVGDNDSATKEAIYLANLVSKLTVINSDGFHGVMKYVDVLKSKENVTILEGYEITSLFGEGLLTGIEITNVKTKEKKMLETPALFPIVGEIPNSSFVQITGLLDENGTIPVERKTMRTAVPHIYAGGDILPRDIRQIYLAEVDAKKAAKAIIDELNK